MTPVHLGTVSWHPYASIFKKYMDKGEVFHYQATKFLYPSQK